MDYMNDNELPSRPLELKEFGDEEYKRLITRQKLQKRKNIPKKGVKHMNVCDEAEENVKKKREDWFNVVSDLTKAQRKKHLAVGIWNEQIKMVEITTEKGKHFSSLGRSINSKTCLFLEEAIFLVDAGLLEVYLHGIPAAIQDLFSLFDKEDVNELNLDRYLAYSYLKKLGYVVLRTSVYLPNKGIVIRPPRVKKQKKSQKNENSESNEEAVKEDNNNNNNDNNTIQHTTSEVTDNKPDDSKSDTIHNNKDEISVSVTAENIVTDETIVTDTKPYRGWYPPSKESHNNGEQVKIVPLSEQHQNKVMSYSQLAVFKPYSVLTDPLPKSENSMKTKDDTDKTNKIMYDIYLAHNFKKSTTEPPVWRLCVYNFNEEFPRLTEIQELMQVSHPVPVKFCVVQNGTVNFFEFGDNPTFQ